MMKDDFEHIIRYFDGELTPAEEKELLKRIESDEGLMKEFRLIEESIRAVEFLGDEEIKAEIRTLLDEDSGRSVSMWRWMGGIAAAAVIAGSVFYFTARPGSELEFMEDESIKADSSVYLQDSLEYENDSVDK